jgi:hypothetical protein
MVLVCQTHAGRLSSPSDYEATLEPSRNDGTVCRPGLRDGSGLDFRHSVSSFFNWGGLGERWFWSRRKSWHFVTTDGGLYKWNGSSSHDLSGTLIAQFSPQYWERPALIYAAANPDPYSFSIQGQTQRNVDFGNIFGRDGSGVGDLRLTVRNTTVTISGSDQANSLAVYGNSQNHVTIQGSGGTTINGSNAPIELLSLTSGLPGDVIISMRGGRDQIVLFDVSLNASLHVDVGTGNDTLMLADSSIAGDLSLTSARGDVQIRLHDGAIARSLSVFNSGDGDSLTSLQDVTVGRNVSVISSGGADTVVFQGAMIANTTHVATGSGPDAIIVHRSLFEGAVQILARNGNDLIALHRSEFRRPLHVYAGNNDDVVGNTSENRFAFSTGFYAGPGNDTYADDGTASHGRLGAVNSFETKDESTLADLIDIALSNFDDLLLN